jgi:hypothetical protein
LLDIMSTSELIVGMLFPKEVPKLSTAAHRCLT